MIHIDSHHLQVTFMDNVGVDGGGVWTMRAVWWVCLWVARFGLEWTIGDQWNGLDSSHTGRELDD